MVGDLGVIFKAYTISLGLQWLIWPWLRRWFKGLVDGGWALGRLVGLLLIGLPIWFAGHIWPVNTDIGVGVVILLLVLLSLHSWRKGDRSVLKGGRYVLMEEGLFLFGFWGLSLIRGFQPDILGLEKFMDFGFVKQYTISTQLPVNDMWLAGEKINYYSFGHFLASILIRVWGVGLGRGYNLMLAWILGTSMVLSFSVIVNLLEPSASSKKNGVMIGGVMGALLTCLGGNTHTMWYLFKNKGLSSYWYADATRFIENTIHEFPGYSFVVSDLHGHVLGLPVVLGFLLILVAMWKQWPRLLKKDGLFLGMLMGVMMMTNTWDVAVYGLLLVVLGVFWLGSAPLPKKQGLDKERWGEILKFGVMIGGVMVLTALPWLLGFEFFSDGVKLVTERSPLWQLGVLWGGHLVVMILAMVLAMRIRISKKGVLGNILRSIKKEKLKKLRTNMNLFVLALGVVAMFLILIPEMLYVKDIYTTHQRANTMFKLTYQAFILMSLLFGWMVGEISTRIRPKRGKKVFFKLIEHFFKNMIVGTMVLVWGGFMLFSIQAYSSYYGGFKEYKGIDGLRWLRRDRERWEMVHYLEENRDGRNLVEAVGDSYSRLNAVSAFSGTPTVIGWRVHEWLWRGGYGVVQQRSDLVNRFYKGDMDEGELEDFLTRFDVGWIVVGRDERKNYVLNEDKIDGLGGVVWKDGESYLLKVN